jgi:uncharacterized OsmC-like protein
MPADELRSIQRPLKERYQKDPQSAVITLKAQGRIREGVTCKVQTRRALVEAGLHPDTGGSGLSVCLGDMLLEALVASAGATLSAVATATNVPLRDAVVCAEDDLDFRGTLGVSKEVSVGFQRIRLIFDLVTDAPHDQVERLIALTERYCVVFQSLQSRPELSVTCRETPPR